MDTKKETEKLLFELKAKGWDRKKIETELKYSPNYISQQLSKGGNEKLYNHLQSLLKKVEAGDYIEYDMAAGVKKIEAMNKVILTAIAELLADKNHKLVSSVRNELEELVNAQLRS